MGKVFVEQNEPKTEPQAKLSEVSATLLPSKPPAIFYCCKDPDCVIGDVFIGWSRETRWTRIGQIREKLKEKSPNINMFQCIQVRNIVGFLYGIGSFLKEQCRMTPVPDEPGWFKFTAPVLDITSKIGVAINEVINNQVQH